MGEEKSGVPVGLFLLFLLPCSEEKRKCQREEGVYMPVLFTSIRK